MHPFKTIELLERLTDAMRRQTGMQKVLGLGKQSSSVTRLTDVHRAVARLTDVHRGVTRLTGVMCRQKGMPQGTAPLKKKRPCHRIVSKPYHRAVTRLTNKRKCVRLPDFILHKVD